VATVLVVGNGPSVLDKPLGKQIDQMPEVVRLNKFTTTKPEFTGKRTTWWVFPEPLWAQMRQHVAGPLELGVTVTQDPRHNAPRHPPMVWTGTVVKVPMEVTRKLMDRYNIWPTTGLVAIQHFLGCGYNVVIHGFDTLFTDFRNCQYMNPKAAMFRTHSPKAERRILHQLLDEGRITTLDPEHRDEGYSPRQR
jgi:hypothetical protein